MAKFTLSPPVEEWLTESRISDFETTIKPCMNLLYQSNLIKPLCLHWIRVQIARELTESVSNSTAALNKVDVDQLLPDSKGSEITHRLDEYRKSLQRSCDHWAFNNWGGLLDSIYLQRRHELDKAEFTLANFPDFNSANECYHRVVNNESNLLDAIADLKVSITDISHSYYPFGYFYSTHKFLLKIIESLPKGSISSPFHLKSTFCLVQIHKYVPAAFNERTKSKLLALTFSEWSRCVVDWLHDAYLDESSI